MAGCVANDLMIDVYDGLGAMGLPYGFRRSCMIVRGWLCVRVSKCHARTMWIIGSSSTTLACSCAMRARITGGMLE